MLPTSRRAAKPASIYQTLPALGLLILLMAGLVLIALSSLDWPMGGDLPANLYVARLMGGHGYIPYRDFWSDNLPGVFPLFMTVGGLAGYTNAFGLRFFDLLHLALLSAVTYRWLRKIGAQAAWAAPVLFGLLYLASDSRVILSANYLLILPIACAILLATALPRLNDRLRAFLIGLMFGLAFTVRLQSIIGLPVVALFAALEVRARHDDRLPSARRLSALALFALAGLALPAVILVLYLIANNAFSPFIEIAANYWPLAAGLTDTQAFVADTEMARYRFSWFTAFDGLILWLAPAGVGLLAAYFPGALSSAQKRLAALIGGMLAAYSLYALIGGSFLHSNWIIFTYLLAALSALCFLSLPREANPVLRWLPLVVLALALASRPNVLRGYADQVAQLMTGAPAPPGDARADAILAYLRENLQPGDTVQALDSGGPAVQAMLIADALPANRHLYGIRFYHDVDAPYVQDQRQEWITALAHDPPRYVVEVSGYPSITGENTTTEFLELQLLMAANYELVASDGTYGIYERVVWPRALTRALVVYGLGEDATGESPGAALVTYLGEGAPANWFETASRLPVTPIPQAATVSHQIAVSQQLAQSATDRWLVSLVYLNEISDESGVIESWASANLYRMRQRWSQRTRVIDYLNADAFCGNTSQLIATFGETEEIRLIRRSVSTISTELGQIVCVHLIWQTDGDTSAYNLAVHIVRDDHTSIAQYDAPFTSWVVNADGIGFDHQIAIPFPVDTPQGIYAVWVIVYDPLTGERLRLIELPGQPDHLTIGEITLQP